MANADLDKQPDSVSSVLKVFGILQALGEEREIGITELSQRVMMSKSTVYRFLQTMKTLGYVAQEGESEKYSLTLKLFELGARALQNVDLIRSADIQMREISRLTKETIHLGALDEDSIVYIHKIDSMYNLRMYSRIGRRNPLYSTAIGKVLLAWRDRDEGFSAISTRTRILTISSIPVHINRKLGQNIRLSLAAPTSWRLGFLQKCSLFFLILVDGNLLVIIKIDTLVVLIYSFALFLIK